jgi:hypothetical protein
VSEKSAIVIPLGAVKVVVPVAPSGARAPPPTRLPIGSLPSHPSSRAMPVAATPVHEWLP